MSPSSLVRGAGFVMAVVIGAGALAGCSDTAVADRSSQSQQCSLAENISVHAPDLYPENGTWDPTRQAFLIGSARQGNVSVVERDGTVRELIPSIGLVSTLGVRVDVARSRILVIYTDFWLRQRIDTGAPPVSGLAIFDLGTGAPLHMVDLAHGPAPFANDVTVDGDGNAYVSDSTSDAVHMVDPDGVARPFVTDPRFAGGTVGLNGIAWDPQGYLLVARYDSGTLFRVSLHDRSVIEVAVPEPLNGTDGMVLGTDGTLIAVTNSIGALIGVPAGANAVLVLRSSDSWLSATITKKIDPWPVSEPTVAMTSPCGDYVLSGNVGVLLTGGSAAELTLRRI